jgi:hypothetical protein
MAAIPITAVFTLEREEIEPAEEEFGKGVFKSPTVSVLRVYGLDPVFPIVDVDEAVAVRTLVERAGLPSEIADSASKQLSLKGLSAFLEQRAKEQQAAHAAAQTEAAAIQDPQEKAKAIDEANKLAETQAAKQLRGKLTALVKSGLSTHIWTDI